MSSPRPTLFTSSFVRLLLMQTTFGLAYSAFLLLPKFLSEELAASASEIGAITAAFGIATTLFTPLAGVWADRFGRRRFAAIGALTMAVGSFGFLWVDQMGPLVYALRFLHGVAFALAFVAGGALVTDQAPTRRLAQAIGFFGLTMLSTNAVAPALAEEIASRAGWGPVFALAGLASLGACALTATLRKHRERPEPGESLPSLLEVIANRRALWYLTISALGGAAFGTMFTFSQPFALELGMTHVRSFFIAYAVTAITMRLALGAIVDRVGHRRVCVFALAIYALCVFWMAGLTPGTLAWIGAVFGMAHGLFYPAFNALVLERATALERGKVLAIIIGAFNAGWAAGTFLLGFVADRFGYPVVFVLAGLGTVAAFALLVAAREIRTPAVCPPEVGEPESAQLGSGLR